MIRYLEEIERLERSLNELSKPPVVISGTSVFVENMHCIKHGNYESVTRKMDSSGRIMSKSSCPDCIQLRIVELRQEHEDHKIKQQQKEVESRMKALELPERFKPASFDNYFPVNNEAQRCLKVCRAYADRWEERLKQGGGIVMCGKPGTGKNHLAFAIAKQIITENRANARFTSALRIARNFKATWQKGAEKTENDVIMDYTKPDLLIIDEIGVQFGSEAEKMIMFEIINQRYEDMKPTILISNLAKEELVSYIGERVIDRMNEGGGCTLSFTWDSYRSRAV